MNAKLGKENLPERSQQPPARTSARGMLLRSFVQPNQAGPAAMQDAPPIVHDVLRSPGQLLDAAARSVMEPHFDRDFSDVRVHTDGKASASTRALGAIAYASGHQIVFRAGRFAPQTSSGRNLLAHELAHVAQMPAAHTGGTTVASITSPWERDAGRAASAVSAGQSYQVASNAPQAIYMRVDPRLETFLTQLQALSQRSVGPLRAEVVVANILNTLNGLDLSDVDNLTPVSRTVSQLFRPDIFVMFLETVELSRNRQRETPREPTAAEVAAMERTTALLQVGPRGPYRQYGPGVVVPVLSQAARGLAPVVHNLAAFFEGLLEGLSGNLSRADFELLSTKLRNSAIISTVLPVIIAAGAAVGIIQDVYNAIRGVVEIIGSLGEFVQHMLDMVSLMVSEEGAEVARLLGNETGRGYAQQLRDMNQMGAVQFTYEIGRLIGPTIVYTVLSVTTAGAVLGAAVSARLSAVLRRLPRFARLLEAIGRRLRRITRRAPDAPHHLPEGPLRVFGGRRLLSQADMLLYERQGGHTLARHGSHHTRRTLRDRIIGEREIPPPRTLPGGVQTTDFRVWQGQRTGAASRWIDDDTMRRSISEIINNHIDDIERAAQSGGPFPNLERVPLNQRVGEGWVTTGGAPAAERGVFWRDDLRRATVVIRGDGRGGWYVLTAYPE